MYKHRCEHTALTILCDKCEYTGMELKLKEHKKQHSKKYIITCTYCLQMFNFRMSYWHHKKDADAVKVWNFNYTTQRLLINIPTKL